MMGRTVTVGLVLAVIAALLGGRAQASVSAETASVVQADEARVAAMLQPDPAALEELLATDCLYVHSSGWAQTKPELLAALKDGTLRYTVLQYTAAPQVRRYGPDTAVLTGTMQLEARPKDWPVVRALLRVTVVYVRQNECWRMASYQSTIAAK